MEEKKLVEWLCGVLDDKTIDYVHRINAGITLLNYASRLRSTTGIASDKTVGTALAASVKAKLAIFAADDGLKFELRILAAGAAL